MLALTALYSQEKSSFKMRDGDMSEVRSLADVVDVVRTRTLSAIGKSQMGATSRYENNVKSDNERDGREYVLQWPEQVPVNSGIIECRVIPKVIAVSGSFMILNVRSGKSIQIGIGLPARYRLHWICYGNWQTVITMLHFHFGVTSLRYRVIFFQLRIYGWLLVKNRFCWRRRNVDGGPTPRPRSF
jgi:hypothetical protein